MMFVSPEAHANWTQGTAGAGKACTDCHDIMSLATGRVDVAVNGLPLTVTNVAQEWNYEAAVTLPANTPFEVDLIFNNMNRSAGKPTSMAGIFLPTAWTSAGGTATPGQRAGTRSIPQGDPIGMAGGRALLRMGHDRLIREPTAASFA